MGRDGCFDQSQALVGGAKMRRVYRIRCSCILEEGVHNTYSLPSNKEIQNDDLAKIT